MKPQPVTGRAGTWKPPQKPEPLVLLLLLGPHRSAEVGVRGLFQEENVICSVSAHLNPSISAGYFHSTYRHLILHHPKSLMSAPGFLLHLLLLLPPQPPTVPHTTDHALAMGSPMPSGLHPQATTFFLSPYPPHCTNTCPAASMRSLTALSWSLPWAPLPPPASVILGCLLNPLLTFPYTQALREPDGSHDLSPQKRALTQHISATFTAISGTS